MILENSGYLVISFDYELMWGDIHQWKFNGYKSNVENVCFILPRLIELLEKYNVSATFTTVGLIMRNGKEDVLSDLPEILPTYENKELSPYENEYINNISNDESYCYFAPKMIELLNSSKNIEVGTQTYSHYYCWAKGQKKEQFDADLRKAVDVAETHGIKLKSIVFPRNQICKSYLDICKKYGLTSYRGNPRHFYPDAQSFNTSSSKYLNFFINIFNRLFRFLDSFINLSGKTSYPLTYIYAEKGLANIKASRFLRPNKKRKNIFEKLKFIRIKNEIIYAAKHGEVYHLWCHPHNLGVDVDENIDLFEKILKVYTDCRNKYGMKSCTMAELAEIAERYK